MSQEFTRPVESALEKAHIPDAAGSMKLEPKDVYFQYPTGNAAIVRCHNLAIEKAQSAVRVGPSGGGQTIIISLFEQFYDIQRGQVLVNGTDIADIDIYEYRKHLSPVTQGPTLFQGALRQNIPLGMDPESVADEQLRAVP